MNIHCLSSEQLEPILERKRNPETSRRIPRIPLDSLLVTILEKANDFVPSLSGSILLDDPLQKFESGDRLDLVFVCCFGPSAERMIGERIPVEKGIAGKVYRTGKSLICNDAYASPDFSDAFDRRHGHRSSSILCVPIRIGTALCGVIELMNRKGGDVYREEERGLLEIFADYISSTIQNAIDGRRIERMVRTDDLTGLANDRLMRETLPVEVERHVGSGKPLSVIFLDLDRFKEVNDNHGHMAGSSTLAEFGRLLDATVGAEGLTLVRYGGDEFIVMLPGTDTPRALDAAERIRLATERHVFLDERWGEDQGPLHLGGIITASLGVATLDSAAARRRGTPLGSLVVSLLQAADTALYDAKGRGKNRISVAPPVR